MWEGIKYAWRSLRREPGISLATVLALALGICLMTYVAAMIHTLRFSMVPWPDADRLVVVVRMDDTGLQVANVSRAEQRAFQHLQTSLEGLYTVSEKPASLHANGQFASVCDAARVEYGAWAMTGVKPIMGRLLNAADEAPGAPPVAMISEDIWRESFAADPRILGRSVTVDSEPAVIVGVMPAGFRFPIAAALWRPYVPPLPAEIVALAGKLKPGVSIAQANADFARINAMLTPADRIPGVDELPVLLPYSRLDFLAMAAHWDMPLAVAGVLLLLAWANACNLLLARAGERAQEMAVRVALGARGAHLLRLLLYEGLLLGGVACALALFLAAWLLAPVGDQISNDVGGSPFWWHFDISVPEAVIAAMLALVSVAVIQFMPLVKAIRLDPMAQLRDGGRQGRQYKPWGTYVLIVFLIAAGVAQLSVCAAFLWERHDKRVALYNFRTDHVLRAFLDISLWPRYRAPEARAALWQRIDAALQAMPEKPRFAMATELPCENGMEISSVVPEGMKVDGSHFPRAGLYSANAGFFDALDIPVLMGRAFDERDTASSAPVAVVDENFARRFWPGQSPLGKTISLVKLGKVHKVVGVVRPARHGLIVLPQSQVLPDVYVPLGQASYTTATIGLIYSDDPAAGIPKATAAKLIRQAVARIDPDLATDVLTDYAEVLYGEDDRVMEGHVATVLAASLLLMVIGLYGAGARMVMLHRREIGIRRAVGCDDDAILRQMLRRNLMQLAVGLPLGLTAAVLFNLHEGGALAINLGSALIVGASLSVVALLSAYVPLRGLFRATPAEVLRYG